MEIITFKRVKLLLWIMDLDRHIDIIDGETKTYDVANPIYIKNIEI